MRIESPTASDEELFTTPKQTFLADRIGSHLDPAPVRTPYADPKDVSPNIQADT
jgi:hypothetical protein